MDSHEPTGWKYLARKPESAYQQLFVAGTRIAARTLYAYYTPGEEWPGLSAEDIAADFNLPVDAVKEAIAYCESDPPEIHADLAMEAAIMEGTGMNDPTYKFHSSPKVLSPQEHTGIVRRFSR